MSRSNWRGYGLLFLSASGFGVMAVLAHLAYGGGANVPTLMLLRFSIAAAILWGLLLWRRDLPRLDGRTLLLLILMGAAGYAGQATCYFSSLNYIPAALTAMLLYLYPLLVAILSWIFLGHVLTRMQAIALMFTLSGLGLMLWQNGLHLAYSTVGVALGAGAGIIYAIYIVVGGIAMKRASALHASTIIMTAAAGTFLVAGLSTDSLHFHLTLLGWAGVLGLVAFGTLLAILTFMAGLQLLGPTRASIISALEPVITVLTAWVFLGEGLGPRQLVGAGLAMVGTFLVQVPTRERRTFAGKTVLLTGASSGIGRATALALAKTGATVVAVARSEAPLELLADADPQHILPCPGDVTVPDDMARAVALAVSATGRLDILINNAGVGLNAAVAGTDPEWLRRCCDVNVIGTLNAIRAAVPVMERQGGGQIVNVGSLAGKLPAPYSGSYAATKHAQAALGDTLRLELKSKGIEVVQIFPGSTDTPFRANSLGHEVAPKPRLQRSTPEAVAARLLRASLNGERDAYVTRTERLLSLAARWLPGLTSSLMASIYARAGRNEQPAQREA